MIDEKLSSVLLNKLKNYDESSPEFNQLFPTIFTDDSNTCYSCKTERLFFKGSNQDKCFFFSVCPKCGKAEYDDEQFSDFAENRYDSFLNFLTHSLKYVD